MGPHPTFFTDNELIAPRASSTMLLRLLPTPPTLLAAAACRSLFLRRRASSMSSASHTSTAAATAGSGRARLRGVVFDMDGTLTVPVIDFPAMYRAVLGSEQYAALGGRSVDILHHIETWAPPEQQRAYEIIAEFERQGLDRLQIMPGAVELCRYLDSMQIRRGLITRNVKAAVDLFHKRFGIVFSPALSRDFRPYKPDPAPLLHICSTWNISPNEVMMIGDSLRDDVVCGKRAGVFTCLLDEAGKYDSGDSFTDDIKPDFKVSALTDVLSLLDAYFEFAPESHSI